MDSKQQRTVTFNTNLNTVFYTYSSDEYDRHTIDYVLKRKLQNLISPQEWKDTLHSLEHFKTNIMVVRSSNVCSINIMGLNP